jgi:hypothetical protein
LIFDFFFLSIAQYIYNIYFKIPIKKTEKRPKYPFRRFFSVIRAVKIPKIVKIPTKTAKIRIFCRKKRAKTARKCGKFARRRDMKTSNSAKIAKIIAKIAKIIAILSRFRPKLAFWKFQNRLGGILDRKRGQKGPEKCVF